MSDPTGGDLHPAFNPAPSPSTPPPVGPTDRATPRDFFKEARARIDADETSRSGYETERAHNLRLKHTSEAEAREARARGEPPRQATAGGKQSPLSASGEPPTGAGDKIRVGNLELSESDFRGLMERHALEESRKATLPADPAGYELKLPDDFVVPPGLELKFDERSPVVDVARRFAHKHGLNQHQFSELAGIWAAAKVAEAQKLQAAIAGERAKLGATGTTRVSAIETFLGAKLGKNLAASLLAPLCTEQQVRAFEKLMEIVVGQGAADFSGAHRDPPTDSRSGGRIPGFESMTFTQRRAAQDAAKAGR